MVDPLVKDAKRHLKNIYYDAKDPGGYGGISRLLKSARSSASREIRGLITRQFVKEWLAGQQGYTLHRPARIHFKRRKIVVGGIDHQWQADLADMHTRASANDEYKWLLVVVDTFSKFAWAVPVKTKSAGDMLQAFEKIFEKASPRSPQKLQTDQGKEFYNSQVKQLLKEKEIHHFSSSSDQKAACAERFNRTIKTKIETAINTTQNERWIDLLDELMEGYNNSVHRTIGMAPSKVTPAHTRKLWSRMYGDSMAVGSSSSENLREGTKVRISNVKGVFDKGYFPNWSEQHFNVTKIKSKPGGNQPQYYLNEYDGEPVTGAFYREEIQPISKNRYRIRVLQERGVRGRGGKGRKEYFVEWIGWPAKYNSWITQDQLTAIKPHGERID